MYDEMEREIDLKDLLYRVCKKWRRVIVGAVIIALLAGAYKFATGMRVLLNEEALEDAQEKYEITLSDYEATGERLKTNIVNLRDKSNNQQEYNEKSVLMKIDPMNKWVGSFMLYIDSKYQIDPSLTYQNIDLTNRLISAYASYLRSGELYNDMLEKLDYVDEIRFLTEIYWVNVDVNSSTISVSCYGVTEENVRTLLGFVQEKIQEKSETILTAIGDHSYDILMESVYSTIDLNLDETQKNNLLAISDYANQIGETNEELSDWEKEPEPQPEYGVWYTVKQTIKFIILGGIVGIVVMMVVYAEQYVMNGTIKTDGDWKLYGIPVLGHIRAEQKKKAFHKLDDWIDGLFGKRATLTEEAQVRLAANNLAAVAKEKQYAELALVGKRSTGKAAGIAEKLEKVGTEIRFAYAGDILADADAAGRLENAEEVLLLMEEGVSTYESLEKVTTILKAWGKGILGVVVLE